MIRDEQKDSKLGQVTPAINRTKLGDFNTRHHIKLMIQYTTK